MDCEKIQEGDTFTGGPQRNNAKMRILWHSVAPWIASGYGKATREICRRLPKYGYQPIISAYYGADPGGIPPYPIPVLPSKEGKLGVISAAKYSKQFNVDVGILFTDFWAFDDFPRSIPGATLYSPMDCVSYSEETMELVKQYHKIISLCRWQQKWLKQQNIVSDCIYHGVDLDIFKPLNKSEVRTKFGIPDKDVFVFGTVAGNHDQEDRKSHARSMKAMRYFLDENPDVKDIIWVYHTVPNDPKGMPLISIAHKLRLEHTIKFMDPTINSIMLTEQNLAELMNCFDVHLLCSKREGFGMPILETQACGVPNICHNSSSMTELIQGHGWLCRSVGEGLNLETTPINSETASPDVYDIARCIENAYFNPKRLEKYSEESKNFATSFSWDSIVEKNWVPVLERMIEKEPN
jgi:glycosyltransferase involved in cell wall biosynthesis